MLPFLNESHDLWSYLKESKKPIVIYGMGDGAIKIMEVCKNYGIEISEIFASDEYVRGHSFLGYKVKTLSEIEELYENFIILLAFAAFESTLLKKIYTLSKKHELYAPDVPVIGEGLFTLDYLISHQSDFLWLWDRLADKKSRNVLSGIINFKISGKIDYLAPISSTRVEDYTELLPLSKGMTYLDLGAYDGDTINELLSLCPTAGEIHAFEPDAKNYLKLSKNTEHLKNCFLYNIGSYSEEAELSFSKKSGRNSAFSEEGKIKVAVNSVDNLLYDKTLNYIKMDVEGAEYHTILGCKNVIKKCSPSLGVATYHRNEDLFTLPKLIDELNPNYKIYLRHNHYIPAWENIYYCIAEDF